MLVKFKQIRTELDEIISFFGKKQNKTNKKQKTKNKLVF